MRAFEHPYTRFDVMLGDVKANKPSLVFAHGWGFHGGVWEKIAPEFDDFEVSYWGPKYIRGGPPLSNAIPDGAICVAFSFGAALVLASHSSRLGGLISIGGFDSLVARGRKDAIVDLLSGLKSNPYAQMRAFWAMSGVNRFTAPEDIDFMELERGLLAMLRLDARAQLDALSCPTLGIASVDDKVVPYEISRDVWDKFELITTNSGGHALPLTRAPLCVETIRGFLSTHVA